MYLRIQKRTSELLSKGNISDKPSQYVDMILFILILLNVTAVCLESVKDIGETYKDTFYAFEIFSVIIFTSLLFVSKFLLVIKLNNEEKK